MCAYKPVEKPKTETIVGQDFYLELTAEKGRHRVFDGKTTFFVYNMTEQNLKTLRETGGLSEEFKGKIRVVSKAGYEYNTNLGVSTFNEFVKLDYTKVLDPSREDIDINVRRKILAATPSKSKLQFTATRTDAEVRSPTDMLNEELRSFGDKDADIYVRTKLPKNTKNYDVGSEKFLQLYSHEIKAIDRAFEEYEKTGDTGEILRFLAALMMHSLNGVNASRETIDLLAYFMYKGCMCERSDNAFNFLGTEANIKKGKKWVAQKLENAEALFTAAKSEAGRTWLVGILQQFELNKLRERKGEGFAVEQEQAQVLDYVMGKYVYHEGAYRKYQDQYVRAKLKGSTEGLEILNPVDYMSVAEKTGGMGEKAAGPSTIGSLMTLAILAPPPIKEEVPPPVLTQQVILKPTVTEEEVEYDSTSLRYIAHVAVHPKTAEEKDGKPKGQTLADFIQANNGPTTLQNVNYLWVIAIEVGGEVFFLNKNWDKKNKQIYAGKLDKDGRSIHPCTYNERGEMVVEERVVAVYSKKFNREGGNDLPSVVDASGGNYANLFYGSKTDLKNTEPSIIVPRVRSGRVVPQIYIVDPIREIETPQKSEGGND